MNKIQTEALQGGMELAVLQIEFQGQVRGRKFAVLDWGSFQELLGELKVGMVFVESYGGPMRSLLIKMDDITRVRSIVTQNMVWVMKLIMADTRVFALTSWDSFKELYDGRKDAQNQMA